MEDQPFKISTPPTINDDEKETSTPVINTPDKRLLYDHYHMCCATAINCLTTMFEYQGYKPCGKATFNDNKHDIDVVLTSGKKQYDREITITCPVSHWDAAKGGIVEADGVDEFRQLVGKRLGLQVDINDIFDVGGIQHGLACIIGTITETHRELNSVVNFKKHDLVRFNISIEPYKQSWLMYIYYRMYSSEACIQPKKPSLPSPTLVSKVETKEGTHMALEISETPKQEHLELVMLPKQVHCENVFSETLKNADYSDIEIQKKRLRLRVTDCLLKLSKRWKIKNHVRNQEVKPEFQGKELDVTGYMDECIEIIRAELKLANWKTDILAGYTELTPQGVHEKILRISTVHKI